MDLPEDSAVEFSFVREHGGAKHGQNDPFAGQNDLFSSHAPGATGALPPAPGADLTPPVLPGVLLPPAPMEAPPPVPLRTTPPPSVPISSFATDEDDALARRLERLKRGD
jgi:hypothetical protein